MTAAEEAHQERCIRRTHLSLHGEPRLVLLGRQCCTITAHTRVFPAPSLSATRALTLALALAMPNPLTLPPPLVLALPLTLKQQSLEHLREEEEERLRGWGAHSRRRARALRQLEPAAFFRRRPPTAC